MCYLKLLQWYVGVSAGDGVGGDVGGAVGASAGVGCVGRGRRGRRCTSWTCSPLAILDEAA